jgi:hypothetical protein
MTLSYVLPIRCDGPCAGAHDDLTAYLGALSPSTEVLVVDGSGPATFEHHRCVLPATVRHLRPDPGSGGRNGKVAGVLTGVRNAVNDGVVIADDDVRWSASGLRRVEALLAGAEVVRPQNYFDPVPWHALWDTARTLVNRSLGGDFPGTLAVRRSFLLERGGYDGDVLFENLELIRTVRGAGGREAIALDLYVARRPPSVHRFLSQRVRQAYDDLAIPGRLAAALLVMPLMAWAVHRRQPSVPGALTLSLVVLAEAGRRRAGGAEVFPAAASCLAPLWAVERGVCAWLAIASRALLGGCRYRGVLISRAASSEASLRRSAAVPTSGRTASRAVVQPTGRRRPPRTEGSLAWRRSDHT